MDSITERLESLLLFVKTGQAFSARRQSLGRVIERAIEMTHPHSNVRSVSILRQIQSEVCGCVDGERLSSALFNLLLNACQVAAGGAPSCRREVVIALYEDRNDVFVRVTDNGPGVPREIQEALFRPFMLAGEHRGTGLGLSIARCVAQEHGGDVYLEQSRPGKTVFVLKLPKGHLESDPGNGDAAAEDRQYGSRHCA
jgi:signal transduction histidine kinase